MRALLIVDVQNDFLEKGALPVPEGSAVIPVINALQKDFEFIVASQDWHPANHCSFAKVHGKKVGDIIDLEGLTQVLWPEHCVQGTVGAQLASQLQKEHLAHIVQKGSDEKIDSYSAFFDNGGRRSTGLYDYLHAHGVDELYIVGLATEYCVKFTVLDALSLGFKVHVIVSACRGITVEGVARALHEMESAGARLE